VESSGDRFGDRDAMADAVEQSPGLFGIAEGAELRFVAASAATFAFVPGKTLLGVPVREAFWEVVGQQIIGLYDECYRTGLPQVAKEWRTVIDPGDGREPFTVYLDCLLYPWRDDRGDVRGVVATANDVTESVTRRMAAEEAQASAEARYRGALAEVRTIQHALLPESLPVLPDLELAARYLLASDDAGAGGDWFDAIVRPSGGVALVVGDVVGHGVRASAVMGQLRAVLGQRLMAGATVPAALADLDLFARSIPGAHAATVCVLETSPGSAGVTYCTAGHPPPLLVRADGSARFLVPTGGGPLATGSDFPVEQATLAPADLVLLYSDGAVERPDRTPEQNTVELLQVVRDSYANRAIPVREPMRVTERVCEQTLELLTRLTGYSDDITVLAAQRVPPPSDLDLAVLSERESVREARIRLGDWLAGLEAMDHDAIAVTIAVGELVTNAVEHAYDTDAGSVRLTGTLRSSGSVEIRVSDTGRWRSAAIDHDADELQVRGRGLGLARALVERLDVRPGTDGTTATLTYRLRRRARLLDTAAPTPARSARRFSDELRLAETDVLADHGPDGRATIVSASGPIDLVSADQLRRELLQLTRGGTRPILLDLSEVTLLASAGVQVLHELHAGSGLTLRAPAGSPAQHVLEIVRLPYLTGGESG
jgi:serine phosphatase RsbU (regulator of sigma subunit)/anti-sigma regulatory factor (Ser/Thr protein kinase)